MGKKRKIALMILNLAAACMGIHGFRLLFQGGGGDNALIFYTEQSNLLCVCSCLMVTGCFFFDKPIPRWLQFFSLTAAADMTVTFIVVVTVLAPLSGFAQLLLRDHMLYHHLLCPILCLACVLLSGRLDFSSLDGAAGAIWPTLLYAGVLACLNASGTVDGPYPFLRVHHQSLGVSLLWYFVILGGAWGIAMLITGANHALHTTGIRNDT